MRARQWVGFSTLAASVLLLVSVAAQDQGQVREFNAGAGQTVTFEFRADRTGSFTFYCNLSQNARCKDMKGTLSVR